MTGTLAIVEMKAPVWLIVMFAGFDVLSVLTYVGAFIYCVFKDRDALRSETYLIKKSAIEKGFVGDSLSGVIPLDAGHDTKVFELPAKAVDAEEDGE